MVFFGDTALAGVTLLSPKATLHDAGLLSAVFLSPHCKVEQTDGTAQEVCVPPSPSGFPSPSDLDLGTFATTNEPVLTHY